MKKIIYTLLFASVLLMFVGCPNPTEQVVDPNLVKIDVPVEVSPSFGKIFIYDFEDIDDIKTYELHFDLNKISSTLKANDLCFVFFKTEKDDKITALHTKPFSSKLIISSAEAKKYEGLTILKSKFDDIELNKDIMPKITQGVTLGRVYL